MSRVLSDLVGTVKALRHFVPAKDFGISKQFYADFGFRARMAKFQLGYVQEPGNHFGIGELDQGEYRVFKDAHVKTNLPKYMLNCHGYRTGQKPLYIPYNP